MIFIHRTGKATHEAKGKQVVIHFSEENSDRQLKSEYILQTERKKKKKNIL